MAISRLLRAATDNGANYRAKDFTRFVIHLTSQQHCISPYVPRQIGTVDWYNQLLADEVLASGPTPVGSPAETTPRCE